jgi:hypothetical protein
MSILNKIKNTSSQSENATVDASAGAQSTQGASAQGGGAQKAGKVTPKRNAAQKKNQRPIASSNKKTKEERKLAREQEKEQRKNTYNAMYTNDESKYPKKDQGHIRHYIRDFVDARLSIGEFFLPIAVVLLTLSFVGMSYSPTLYLVTTYLVWGYILIIIVDSALMITKLTRELRAKFGKEKMGDMPGYKHYRYYACMRALNFRKLRLPKPYYTKRGNWPK